MARSRLLTQSEESKLIALAKGQPRSAKGLQALINKIKAQAIKVALEDSQVTTRLTGTRHRVIASDLTEGESKDATTPPLRLVQIGIYDYDTNVLVVPIVDLREGRVMVLHERSGYHPAPHPEEIEEAKGIVLAQPEFRALDQYSGLELAAYPARAAAIESHPGFGHRCITLYFWTTDAEPRRVSQAVVDLSAQKVIPGETEGEPFLRP